MEYRKLELTVVSGQDIGPGLREGRVQVYALVSFNGDPATAQKTDVDREGGKNPTWNRTFTHTIPDLSVRDPGSEVVAKFYYQTNRGDLFVGEVKIPIPTLFDCGIRASAFFNVVPTGRLNIAYRFGETSLVRNQSTLFKRNIVLPPMLAKFISYLGWSGRDSEETSAADLLFNTNREVVLKLGVHDKKEMQKAMKLVSSSQGVKSVHMDTNAKELTIVGEVDPVQILGKLRKYWHTELLRVGPAVELKKKDEGTPELEKKKDKGSSEFRFGTSSSQYLRTERKDEDASESRFGSRDGGKIKEINDEAKSDRNKRYLEDFILPCSVFPLDYEFTKDILIGQWIAGGLIELGEDEETEEVCTEECFDTLMDMNYIIPSGYDYVLDQTRYKIGDKMTTFLQNQLLEPKFGKYLDSKRSHHDPNKIEFLSLTFKEIDRAVLNQYSRLHTLVIHDCCEVDHLPSDLFSELKALKILILSRTNIVELPKSVENLKELQFLDMSETPLVWLPETICCFTHLQTLKLDGCLQLEGLPEGTSNLINLRHLILDVVRQLESMPVGIGNLSNLRTLSAFLVGEEDGCSVRELKDMNKLRGTFRLLNLENVKTKEEASEACLYKKVDLKKIELQWSDIEDEKIPHEEEILESLKPGVGIQELKILFYSGGVLPSWICDPSFKELVTIFLYKCRYCISLPSLGQLPSLKHLSIIENNVVVEINSSFYRKQINQYRAAFPKLEKLTFESMSRLERWMISLDFRSLRHLIIEHCPKLVELPHLWCLGSLSHLEIRYCPELSLSPSDELPPRLQSLMIKESPRLKEWCRHEDWSKIAHVPTVYFDHHKFSPRDAHPEPSRNQPVHSSELPQTVLNQHREKMGRFRFKISEPEPEP